MARQRVLFSYYKCPFPTTNELIESRRTKQEAAPNCGRIPPFGVERADKYRIHRKLTVPRNGLTLLEQQISYTSIEEHKILTFHFLQEMCLYGDGIARGKKKDECHKLQHLLLVKIESIVIYKTKALPVP